MQNYDRNFDLSFENLIAEESLMSQSGDRHLEKIPLNALRFLLVLPRDNPE